MLPFSAEQFFSVFRDYNEAVWPMQWVLYGVALVAAGLAFSRSASGQRWIAALLGLLWAWTAVAYHFVEFTRVNPAAYLFALLFLGEATLLVGWSLAGRPLHVSFRFDPRGVLGGIMLLYALLGYPALNATLGPRFPESPTFGVPCPTTIFTLGLLTVARAPPARMLLAIPILWSFIGGSAAFVLGVTQDLGLLISGLAAGVALVGWHSRA